LDSPNGICNPITSTSTTSTYQYDYQCQCKVGYAGKNCQYQQGLIEEDRKAVHDGAQAANKSLGLLQQTMEVLKTLPVTVIPESVWTQANGPDAIKNNHAVANHSKEDIERNQIMISGIVLFLLVVCGLWALKMSKCMNKWEDCRKDRKDRRKEDKSDLTSVNPWYDPNSTESAYRFGTTTRSQSIKGLNKLSAYNTYKR
jgi:hypothetical protein